MIRKQISGQFLSVFFPALWLTEKSFVTVIDLDQLDYKESSKQKKEKGKEKIIAKSGFIYLSNWRKLGQSAGKGVTYLPWNRQCHEDGKEKLSLDILTLAGAIGRKACHGQQFNFIRSLFKFRGDGLMIQFSLREKKIQNYCIWLTGSSI